MKRGMSYVLSVALITLPVLAIGAYMWSTEPPPLVLQPETTTPPDNNPSGTETPTVSAPVWWRGVEDAIVVIDTFPDFECIACCETEAVAADAMGWYTRVTKMVYHHYPLSELGQVIAEALEEAGAQGKFWELHDKVVEDMPRDVEALKVCAAEVGLDMPALEEALSSGKHTETVNQEKEKAVDRGVTESVIFINGKEYHKYPPDVGDLSAMIVEAKSEAGG